MRFAITGEWRTNSLLRLILGLFLVLMIFFWATGTAQFFSAMSLSYDGVVEHYLGKPDGFGGPAIPRSFKVMLEVSHAHLFAMGILLLTLTHMVLFLPIGGRAKAVLSAVVFLSALLNEGASWLIRYVHPAFAYLKLSAFVLLQVSLALAIVLLLLAVLRKWPSGYGNGRGNGHGCPRPAGDAASNGEHPRTAPR